MMRKFTTTALALTALGFSSQAAADGMFFSLQGDIQYWQYDADGPFHAATSDASHLSMDERWNGLGEADESGGLLLTANFHHPLPLIPNIRLQRQEMDFGGDYTGETYAFGDIIRPSSPSAGAPDGAMQVRSDIDLGYNAATLYYRFFDNRLVRLQLGGGVRQYDGYAEARVTGPADVQADYPETVRYDLDFSIPYGYALAEVGLPFTGLSIRAEGMVNVGTDHSFEDLQAALRYQFMDTMLVNGYVNLGYRRYTLDLDEADGLSADWTFDGPFASLAVHF